MIALMVAIASKHHSIITTVVSWLDKHQGSATVILTAALIAVTITYTVQNIRMVREMQRARGLSVEQHEADEHRERLRELRTLTDDATCALSDLWTVLGAFAYAFPRGEPPVSRRSPIEHRDPDPQQFIEVYGRLRSARIRLVNRVEWGDTFASPVARAMTAAQQAYNPVVHEDPRQVRSRESEQAIHAAIAAAQDALREIQETSRERFAPLGLSDSRYTSIMLLTIKRPGHRADELLAALRDKPSRLTTVDGPDREGRITVRDEESAPGEARSRLVASLDAAGSDWHEHLDAAPTSDADIEAWTRRQRTQDERSTAEPTHRRRRRRQRD